MRRECAPILGRPVACRTWCTCAKPVPPEHLSLRSFRTERDLVSSSWICWMCAVWQLQELSHEAETFLFLSCPLENRYCWFAQSVCVCAPRMGFFSGFCMFLWFLQHPQHSTAMSPGNKKTGEDLWYLIGIQADVSELGEEQVPDDHFAELQMMSDFIRDRIITELSEYLDSKNRWQI